MIGECADFLMRFFLSSVKIDSIREDYQSFTERTRMLAGSILRKLRDNHALGHLGGRSLSLGVYYKNTLVALCHALEDALLENDYQPLVITAFQRGQWYLQEAERYAELAERSRHIAIMAAPEAGFQDHPTGQRPNVSLISLGADDPVGQEWHLIIVSPRYTAMVLCQELTVEDYGAAGVPKHDLERKFYGMWTFEPRLVQETAGLAIAHIQGYNPSLAAELEQQLADIIKQTEVDTQATLPTTDNLGDIVGRVISYLQTSQQDLFQHDSLGFDAYPFPLDKNLVSNELQAFLRIAQLIDQTDLSNPMAAAEVATLAESLGQLLDIPAWQLHRLRLAGLLHRIAAMPAIQPALSLGEVDVTETESPPFCPLLPGAQVLRRMSRMRAIATILTHITEAWDGSGFPASLSGDAIPLESRLLGLVACFQQRLAALRQGEAPTGDIATGALDNAPPEALAEALAICQAEASYRWDPKMVEALSLLVSGLQQGLSLSIAMPQVASGLWLLDSHSEEDLYARTFSSPTPS